MADKIKETLEFKTQIHTAWDGAEQRMALRDQPRRYVSYDYIGVKARQSQYLRLLTGAKQTELILFPLWHAASILPYAHYKGQAVVQIQTEAMWGFRNIGAVELWTSDELGGAKYDLKYITASGLLGLQKQLQYNWPGQATTVLPVFYGVLQQEDKFENWHSGVTTLTVNLELLQNQRAPEFPASWDEFHDEPAEKLPPVKALPERYLGAEIFPYYPRYEENIESSYIRNANRLDNETGIFRYDLKSEETTQTQRLTLATLTRAESYNLQRFFYRCKGRLRSFWLPTWLSDVELAEDAEAGDIYLLTKLDQYYNYCAQAKRRRILIVFLKSGAVEILKIAGYSVSDDGRTGRIYLEQNLKRALRRRDVYLLSYLCRVRFAEDVLTVDYETTGVATATVGFTEVDG